MSERRTEYPGNVGTKVINQYGVTLTYSYWQSGKTGFYTFLNGFGSPVEVSVADYWTFRDNYLKSIAADAAQEHGRSDM